MITNVRINEFNIQFGRNIITYGQTCDINTYIFYKNFTNIWCKKITLVEFSI